MSWQGYIDNLKAPNSSKVVVVEEAAICGTENGQEAVWACSPGLANVTAEEIKKLAFNRQDLVMCGPKIGGKKCILVNDCTDNEHVRCLNLKCNEEDGSHAVAVGRTNKTIIIAKAVKDVSAGTLDSHLFTTIEYLRGQDM